MTAKDLKNALLQEAVQGKLVPQIASEGSARDLLEEIRKERLSHGLDFANAKSGKKSKKETALAGSNPCDISEEEKPFDIPESWCWCRLGDLSEIITKGSSPSWQGINYVDNGILFVTSENVGDEELLLSKKKYLEPRFNDIQSRSILKKGDLLTNIVGASIGRTAIFNLDIKNANINQAVALIRLKNIEFNSYLVKVLNSKVIFDQMSDNTVNTARANISLTTVENFKIPLPPLAEQKRIVAAIEKFMPLIEEYGKKETVLNELNANIGTLTKKAILQEAVQGKLVPQIPSEGNARDLLGEIRKSHTDLQIPTESAGKKKGDLRSKSQIRVTKKSNVLPEIPEEEKPFDIPENWCWCRLGEICTKLVDGDHNPPAGINEKTEYIMASSRNINKDTLVDLDLVRYLTKDVFEKENERTNAQEGDIFFTGVGTLGRSCIYNGELNICFQRSVSVIKTEIYNKYLKYCLDNPIIQDFIIANSTGTAQKGFYLNQLAELIIPLPPLSEQKRIVEAIEKLLPMCERLGK